MSNKRKKSKTSSKKRSTTKRKPASRKPATRTGTAARGTNKRKNSKNRKNKIILISVLVALCIVLAVVIGVIVHLVKTPKIDLSLDNMQEVIEADWTKNNSDYPEGSFMVDMDNASSFVVTNVEEIEDDCYTVTCEVSAPDMLDEFKAMLDSGDISTEKDDMNESFKQLIASADVATTEQTVTVYQTDGTYCVEYSEEFANAMLGNIYTFTRTESSKLFENLGE